MLRPAAGRRAKLEDRECHGLARGYLLANQPLGARRQVAFDHLESGDVEHPLYSPYTAWKWGTPCSRKYILMVMP